MESRVEAGIVGGRAPEVSIDLSSSSILLSISLSTIPVHPLLSPTSSSALIRARGEQLHAAARLECDWDVNILY